MTAAERGFLLLTSQLGNPGRKPLTPAQLRKLAVAASQKRSGMLQRELTSRDLTAMGYDSGMAERIVALLEEEALLEHYLRRGLRYGCTPVTRVTEGYPVAVRRRLGLDSPGCLWCKGDLSLLDTAKVALVGSRTLNDRNRAFAREVGRQAALQGYTLVSGNASGADREAQQACLEAGGSVIAVVADALINHWQKDRILYLSEDDYDQPFSAQRALSRNRIIHTLGEKTFVAQSDLGKGGTWSGTTRNLRFGWSPVFGCDDGSEAMRQLEQLGVDLIFDEDLRNFASLYQNKLNFFDQ